MDRYWLLTWTTYGSWLPGDRRGFVSNVAEDTDRAVRHNIPQTRCDADMPALHQYMQQTLRGEPIYLLPEHAAVLLGQFQETARHRCWLLMAASVMANHVHLVVAVPGDPDPADVLRDFKSYGSRSLNLRWGKPVGGTWWTESGSKRTLPDERALLAAIRYVREQKNALIVWTTDDPTRNPASGGRQPPVTNQQGADAPRSPAEDQI